MVVESTNPIKRWGVLDIGSNSVRLVIYELFGAHFSPVYNEKILAGLGRDLQSTSKLSSEGRQIARDALLRFKKIIDAQNLQTLLIGATAALRVAKDAPEFIADIASLTGLDITPISGQEEARLTAMGLLAAEPRANGLAADLGGASLEFVHVKDQSPQTGISLPLGPFESVKTTLSDPDIFKDAEMASRIDELLEKAELETFKGQTLYLIGGAWRNLAAIHQKREQYPMRTLQAYSLDAKDALALAYWSYGEGFETILSWPGIRKRRAETIPYGGYLLAKIIELMSPDKVVISTTGLREGLVYDAMPETLRQRDALFDGCRDLAKGNLQAVSFGGPLYNFLEDAAEHFPHCFDRDSEIRLRRAACYLVGIGKGLHPDYRANLVFDDVLYAPISGLTHKERAYLALILFSSYTSTRSLPNPALECLLDRQEQLSAQAYGTAIRLAVIASGRSPDLLKSFDLNVENGSLIFSVAPDSKDLMSDRVGYRLQKLSQISGLPVKDKT